MSPAEYREKAIEAVEKAQEFGRGTPYALHHLAEAQVFATLGLYMPPMVLEIPEPEEKPDFPPTVRKPRKKADQ